MMPDSKCIKVLSYAYLKISTNVVFTDFIKRKEDFVENLKNIKEIKLC